MSFREEKDKKKIDRQTDTHIEDKQEIKDRNTNRQKDRHSY